MTEMLSLYLINNNLTWNWEDYEYILEIEDFSMKKYFLKILFERILTSY